jgi:predicted Rossmann fold flavoprotein
VRIAVAGGGAAGFFGAISAATHHPSAKIVLFEATHKPLNKVRISGGGRCNVTHHCFDPVELAKGYPRGNKELLGPFHRFQASDTVAWFEKQGVRLKTEEDGRMFPITDRSSTVVDCLLKLARELGVQVRLGARVKSIRATAPSKESSRFEIELQDGLCEHYYRLLLATGSSPHGLRLAEALGHSIVPCVPSLFTFKVSDSRLAGLAGISFEKVKLTLKDNDGNQLEQTGDLLITHWGLSGPAVLKLSARGARTLQQSNYQAELVVNLLPNLSTEQLYQELLAHKEENSRKRVQKEPVLKVPGRYWSRIAQYVGIAGETIWANITNDAINALVSELSGGRFAVSGKGIFKEEFVTCGGVSLKEVDFKTMQSKLCPGLYFAGEILDIDGITGGFNFQSAWTTGWIAGLSIVSSG